MGIVITSYSIHYTKLYEELKQTLEAELADPALYRDNDLFASKSKEYADVDRKLARYYQRWEEAQTVIDAVEAELRNLEDNS